MGFRRVRGHDDSGISRRQLLRGGALAGLGVVGAGVLSACGSPIAASLAGGDDNPDGVTYWNLFTGGDGANMVAMEDAYTQANPGADLQATTLAWGDPYYTKLALATAAGQPPDVAIAHVSRMPLLAQAGLLADLDEFDLGAAGITQQRFTPAAWKKAHQNGHLYAVPLDTHPFVMFYNTKVAKQVGLVGNDDTLVDLDDRDRFVEALGEMKQATGTWGGVVTIVADPSTNWRWFYTLYLQSGGSDLVQDDGTQNALDRDRAAETLDFMRSLTGSDGLFPPAIDPPGTTSIFGSGQAGVLLDGEWQVPTYQATGLDFSVVPVPAIGGSKAAAYADSHTFVIPHNPGRSPEQTARAVGFIRTMLDRSLTWAQGGHVPAWLPVQQSQQFESLRPQSNYVEAAYQAHYDPVAWYTGAGSNFQTTVGSSISAAQSGELSVSAAVDQMASSLTQLASTRPPVSA